MRLIYFLLLSTKWRSGGKQAIERSDCVLLYAAFISFFSLPGRSVWPGRPKFRRRPFGLSRSSQVDRKGVPSCGGHRFADASPLAKGATRQTAHRATRRRTFGPSIVRLHQASSPVVSTLLKVMVDQGAPPSTRVRAADSVLALA
jgi:hypothetical protein